MPRDRGQNAVLESIEAEVAEVEKSILLTVDAFVNLTLGLLLTIAPLRLGTLLGIPLGDSLFLANMLGAVLLGIGLALLLERFRPLDGARGLDLGGAICINLCAILVLAAWLVSPELQLSLYGALFLWALVIVVLGISAVEILALLKAVGEPDSSNLKKLHWLSAGFGVVALAIVGAIMVSRFRQNEPEVAKPEAGQTAAQTSGQRYELPPPSYDGQMSVEQALLERRSIRAYEAEPLTLDEISQLLWAAQGITHPRGYRTAPSAGALYPLEVHLLAGNVANLPAGVYRYRPERHDLIRSREGDHRQALSEAALDQEAVHEAAAVVVFSGVFERTTQKYGQRGVQYVHAEAGSAAQNLYLQAAALGLGTVIMGAFYEDEVRRILNLKPEELPLCLMPVGRPIEG